MAAFELNKIYNFNTLAPAVLGTSFTNMKVKGIMSASEAMKNRDIYTLHNNLLTTITGLPTNVNDLTFILFTNLDGVDTMLALEYIDTFTVVLVSTTNIRIDVLNTTTNDVSILRTRLLELGYTNINITTY